MREKFDVAIIGGGPAAVFAAYEFSLKYPERWLFWRKATRLTSANARWR